MVPKRKYARKHAQTTGAYGQDHLGTIRVQKDDLMESSEIVQQVTCRLGLSDVVQDTVEQQYTQGPCTVRVHT